MEKFAVGGSDLKMGGAPWSALERPISELASDFLPARNPESENPKSEICPTCGGRDFWSSVYGTRNCRICLPPIDPSQIADLGTTGSHLPVGPAQPIRNPNPDLNPNPNPKSESIDSASEIVVLPREVSWPAEVFDLPWPGGEPPTWLWWRTEIRFVVRRSGRDVTHVPVDWARPSWIQFPDPGWPVPKPRWAPNDLAACWFCGRTLFWRDGLGDERCALCSPPREADGRVGWFLKPGPAVEF